VCAIFSLNNPKMLSDFHVIGIRLCLLLLHVSVYSNGRDEQTVLLNFTVFAFIIRDMQCGVTVGLDDASMEEVRLHAYEAKASGNFNAYVSMLNYSFNCCL